MEIAKSLWPPRFRHRRRLVFNGATSATNINGTGVQINWSQATGSDVAGYTVYPCGRRDGVDGAYNDNKCFADDIRGYGINGGQCLFVCRARGKFVEPGDGNLKCREGFYVCGYHVSSSNHLGYGDGDIPASGANALSTKI